jgi:hypothetical protein
MDAHQLTPQQRTALEWIMREAIDFAFERDLDPKAALSEAADILLIADLTGDESVAKTALELVDKAQARVDAMQVIPQPEPKRDPIVDELRDLVSAARGVIDNWSSGDLAGAVNALEEAVEGAEGILTDRDMLGEGKEI